MSSACGVYSLYTVSHVIRMVRDQGYDVMGDHAGDTGAGVTAICNTVRVCIMRLWLCGQYVRIVSYCVLPIGDVYAMGYDDGYGCVRPCMAIGMYDMYVDMYDGCDGFV